MKPVFGPYRVELKVHIIDENNGQRGEATIAVGNGSMPTEIEVAKRIEKLVKELNKHAPSYRLQTAPEMWDSICLEKTGETFAVPSAFMEFADPETKTA